MNKHIQDIRKTALRSFDNILDYIDETPTNRILAVILIAFCGAFSPPWIIMWHDFLLMCRLLGLQTLHRLLLAVMAQGKAATLADLRHWSIKHEHHRWPIRCSL